MRVKDLIKELLECNMDDKIIVVHTDSGDVYRDMHISFPEEDEQLVELHID